MSKYSYLHELYMAYTDEQDARLQRYMQNVRAACVRSGGYAGIKGTVKSFLTVVAGNGAGRLVGSFAISMMTSG
ncbi:hypothetical protein QR238_16825 [Salmonella enterica]|nr:hypothetical protein [Salmonella enterica subsp. enterica serovar Newport]MDL3690046.1 hypothetical protein [Salmonella enterica]